MKLFHKQCLYLPFVWLRNQKQFEATRSSYYLVIGQLKTRGLVGDTRCNIRILNISNLSLMFQSQKWNVKIDFCEERKCVDDLSSELLIFFVRLWLFSDFAFFSFFFSFCAVFSFFSFFVRFSFFDRFYVFYSCFVRVFVVCSFFSYFYYFSIFVSNSSLIWMTSRNMKSLGKHLNQ